MTGFTTRAARLADRSRAARSATRRLRHSFGGVALSALMASAVPHSAHGQAKPEGPASSPPARMAAAPKVDPGPSWSALKPAQRDALKTLERDWPTIDGARKQKWLEIADRYPSISPTDQVRLQARMAEWAKMTPQERSQVRLQFQEAKQVPAQDRQAGWQAYQALPPEQRRELADRAVPAAPPATRPLSAASAKTNTVPPQPALAPPKAGAPAVLQARPGATTTLITKPATPPPHQPTGMPKIAASPEYVDKSTLLPQTGPQSASARPAAASAPAARQ